MNIANLYRTIKQILNDSNVALANKGLSPVASLTEIPSEIDKLGSINRLPYVLSGECAVITEEDLNGATSIGTSVFLYMRTLTDITIPDSVITIETWAFAQCQSLVNVTIGNNVTHINVEAFGFCGRLPTITIPPSVTYIGSYAFNGCTRLTDIYLKPTTPPTLGNSGAIPSRTTIHVPVGSGDAYKSATNWSQHADKIVEDIVIE